MAVQGAIAGDHFYYKHERSIHSVIHRRIFHDVTLPRQRKKWSIMAVQGAIAGDHFCYKHERNIVVQLE